MTVADSDGGVIRPPAARLQRSATKARLNDLRPTLSATSRVVRLKISLSIIEGT